MIEINFAKERKEVQSIFLSASLLVELKQEVRDLLKEFKHIFAWTYVEMPGLDSQLVTHQLNIKELIKLVKHASRNFRRSSRCKLIEVI